MSARNFLTGDTTGVKSYKLLEQCIAKFTKLKTQLVSMTYLKKTKISYAFIKGKTTINNIHTQREAASPDIL